MITMKNVTKTFPNGKGLFNISLSVNEGEVFGYLGPNGAGKSTTIRQLMGFIRQDEGSSNIFGKDCWSEAAEIKRYVGYLPGEISILEGMNGLSFLKLLQGMGGYEDHRRRDKLIERFQLDASIPIRKMSKGMKQKVGIVVAFMHDPQVLILDEPTSGLDPLMQQVFVDLILEEKQKGKTIFMSSHIFSEIERTCDRVAIIKEGRLVTIEDVHALQGMKKQIIDATLSSVEEALSLQKTGLQFESVKGKNVSIVVQGNYKEVLQILSQYNVAALQTRALDLEQLFMHYYDAKEGANHE